MSIAEAFANLWERLFAAEAAATNPLPPPVVWNGDSEPETKIPLNETFRFAHEPVPVTSAADHFVGREADLDRFVQRILFSDGGSFLLTGYRGVGKTSFVNQVIRRLGDVAARLDGRSRVQVIDIYLTLARSVTPAELMHYVIRALYERLDEKNLLDRLPPTLRADLRLAFKRTATTVTQKTTAARETQYGVEAAISNALIGSFKATDSRKKTDTSADELTYLGYDEKAAENDVIRIARRLSDPELQLKIVFVFDELDKIDETSADQTGAITFLDQMLSTLKNVFTTSGISFVFVAGKNLRDRWVEDLGRGDSIYESVFCYDKYLPCLWEQVDTICRRFVRMPLRDSAAESILRDFEGYLAYTGRGIPRRILREFNSFVRWDGTRLPYLAFSRADRRRLRFFAELNELLQGRWSALRVLSDDDAIATRRDKDRLGMLYTVDWILSRGIEEFSAEDVVAASFALSVKIAPARSVAPVAIDELLRILVQEDYLVEVRQDAFTGTIIQPISLKQKYRLSVRRLAELGETPEPPEIGQVGHKKGFQSLDRFRDVQRIAAGGMGAVYRAWDAHYGRIVAVKVMELETSSEALNRFRREAELLRALRHQNIVQFYEFLDKIEPPAIVMEYIEGSTLDDILRNVERMPPAIAARIAVDIARVIAYVHEQGIVRTDLKPSNVLASREGLLYLNDFGIAKRSGVTDDRVQTLPGVVIGTPAFMAPEQFDAANVDERTDIYAFGVLLFDMLTGRFPFGQQESWKEYLRRARHLRPARCSEVVELPPSLDDLVARCLEREPEKRFASAGDVVAALSEVPMADEAATRQYIRDHIEVVKERERKQAEATAAWPRELPAAAGMTGAVAHVRAAERSFVATVSLTPMLRVIAPAALVGISIPLSERIRIGRSETADLMIDDAAVSRLHAEVVRRGDEYFVVDYNTANGTFVDGTRVDKECRLQDGARIGIGANVVILFLNPAAE